MASTDLLFSQLPNPPGGPVEIVFGDDSGLPPGAVELLASGTITGLRGRIGVRVATRLRAAGAITGLRGRLGVRYDVNVERPVAAMARSGWQNARPLHVGTQVRYEQASPVHAPVQVVWQDARTVGAMCQARWQQAQPLQALVRQYQQQAQRVGSAPTLQRFEDAARLRTLVQQRMQQALPVAAPPTAQRFEDATRLRHLVRSSFEQGQRLQAAARDGFGRAVPLSRVIAVRYEEARKPPPGISKPVQPPAVDPCYVPSLPAHLVFEELADSSQPVNLVFVCERHGPGPQPGETIVVPVRRFYMTVNNLLLVRVDGNVPIPAYTFGMSLDVDSWTWSWAATLHADALPLIQPDVGGDPVDIQATINGVQYRLAAESYSRQRQFGNTRISVKGRGMAAILDSPYAPVANHGNTVARTAQQLMSDVLTLNGVGIGWGVDFGLQDWLVPGNVWTHQGSYISALQDIAQAVGGYLQPHNTAQTLRVLARYPAAPWYWAGLTPDYELPSAVVEVEGIEWQRLPSYKRVFVEGTKPGIGCRGDVNRAGTAGGLLAPMVVHPLITHPDAARQRGIAELSNTGTQAHISLRLPVLAETGVIKPGALVRYVDGATTHLGLVRSTEVEWQEPVLRQVLMVETHPS